MMMSNWSEHFGFHDLYNIISALYGLMAYMLDYCLDKRYVNGFVLCCTGNRITSEFRWRCISQDRINCQNNHVASEMEEQMVTLDMKGCICHFVKWRIHPFISKGLLISWKIWAISFWTSFTITSWICNLQIQYLISVTEKLHDTLRQPTWLWYDTDTFTRYSRDDHIQYADDI